MERIHERVQKVLVQLTLQIPNGCSQGALHESLKRKLFTNFNNLPYFQVYLHGLGSQLWSLDAKLDNEVQITYTRLRTKIRETILPAFKECLQPADYASFCEWFKKRGNTNKEWMKITEDTVPFPGVPPHFWGVMSDGDTLPDFTADHVNALFGVDGPASGVGGQATAPAPATDQGSLPAVEPAAQFNGVDRAVAVAGSRPPQALVRGTPTAAASSHNAATSSAAAPPRPQEPSPPRAVASTRSFCESGATVGGRHAMKARSRKRIRAAWVCPARALRRRRAACPCNAAMAAPRRRPR